jgi:hypothetical protein
MVRVFAVLVSAALVGSAFAQETSKPADPKAPEKKAEPKKDAPKADEKPAEEVDVQKTAERIAENAQKAGSRLKEKDPGADTRKIQEEILKDIDALLKKAQQPPPPPMDSDTMPPMPPPPMSDMMPPPKDGMPPPKGGMPPPKGGTGGSPMPKGGMGGGSGMPMPKGGTGGGASGTERKDGRRPRRERKPRGGSPMSMGEPMAKADPGGKEPRPAKLEPKEGPMGGQKDKPAGDGMADKFGKASPKRENDKLADLYKDVWGHLPDRLRQEMDLYYREQFMPRYSELLRQYYAALAEQRKKGSEDR